MESPTDARAKVRKLAEAGVDVIKLIDQDRMSDAEVTAVVEKAHRRGLRWLRTRIGRRKSGAG